MSASCRHARVGIAKLERIGLERIRIAPGLGSGLGTPFASEQPSKRRRIESHGLARAEPSVRTCGISRPSDVTVGGNSTACPIHADAAALMRATRNERHGCKSNQREGCAHRQTSFSHLYDYGPIVGRFGPGRTLPTNPRLGLPAVGSSAGSWRVAVHGPRTRNARTRGSA